MEFFIIGGEQIYKTFHTFLNRIFVTDVFCGPINGDAKFDVDFDAKEGGERSEWLIKREDDYPKSDNDEFPFRVTEYRRRKPVHRYRVKEELMGRKPDMDLYWDRHAQRVAERADMADGQLDFFS